MKYGYQDNVNDSGKYEKVITLHAGQAIFDGFDAVLQMFKEQPCLWHVYLNFSHTYMFQVSVEATSDELHEAFDKRHSTENVRFYLIQNNWD